MTNYSDLGLGQPSPSSPPSRLPIPVSKPFFTYILLAAIIIIWSLMEIYGWVVIGRFGGSQNTAILRLFGANDGQGILQGETWRLFTAMFLHVGLAHLFFNAYALFLFGLEMERLYGPDRYIVIYLLSGLFGSLASFAARGPYVLSVGASGAIFGVIGMNLAFFLIHRETFGRFGRQRIVGTLFIIGINLVFGFTVPGIDNLAHLGGLVAGFVIGYGLAPRYETIDLYTLKPRVIDKVSLLNHWWVPSLAIIILAGGVSLALSFWSGG